MSVCQFEAKRPAARWGLAPAGLVLLLLAACLLAAGAGPARADEDGEFKPSVVETKTIALGEMGDARVTVSIAYKDGSLFKDVSRLVRKYKNFITRHYDRDNTLKVVENFKQEIDNAGRRFVLTYQSPGYAYNWGEYWSVGGMGEHKLTRKTAGSMEFEYDYHARGDLTYYRTVGYRLIMKYKAPKGAKALRFDRTDGRVKYRLDPPPPGFFSANRAWLSVVFGVLSLVFLGLLALFLAKGRRGALAPGGAPGAAREAAPGEARAEVTSASAPAGSPARRAVVTEESPAGVSRGEGEPRGSELVCGNCGRAAPGNRKYCTGCGGPLR